MHAPGQVSPELARLVGQEVQGEGVRWLGRPDARRVLLMSLPAWLFGIPWTVFSIGWTSVPLLVLFKARGPDPMGGWGGLVMLGASAFGALFVMVGIGMLVSPFMAWRQARRTAFALTERRLVIVETGRSTNITRIPLASVREVKVRAHRGGGGDVSLCIGHSKDSDGDLVKVSHTMVGIADVARVVRLIESGQSAQV